MIKVVNKKGSHELNNVIVRAISLINEKLKRLRKNLGPNPLFIAVLDFLTDNCKKFKVYDLASAVAALICSGDRERALEMLRKYSSARGIEYWALIALHILLIRKRDMEAASLLYNILRNTWESDYLLRHDFIFTCILSETSEILNLDFPIKLVNCMSQPNKNQLRPIEIAVYELAKIEAQKETQIDFNKIISLLRQIMFKDSLSLNSISPKSSGTSPRYSGIPPAALTSFSMTNRCVFNIFP